MTSPTRGEMRCKHCKKGITLRQFWIDGDNDPISSAICGPSDISRHEPAAVPESAIEPEPQRKCWNCGRQLITATRYCSLDCRTEYERTHACPTCGGSGIVEPAASSAIEVAPQFLHNYTAEMLLGRAVNRARDERVRKRFKHPRWLGVSWAFAIGSTYSKELCRKFNLDPDEEVTR